ncbi:MAG TPA: O-antigen ligase family protein [Thermomicrobiales bacterium]|nr:O-antigen ligase family protein [Thermomicrobiales bacterium]
MALAAAGREGWRALLAAQGPARLAGIALVAVALASPWPPLTLVALVAYAVVAFKRPGLTTALIPLCAPFAYVPKRFYGPEFPVVELLLLLALATAAVQVAALGWRSWRAGAGAAALLDSWDAVKAAATRPFGVQAVALALIATFSLATVADPAFRHESLREYRTVIVEPLIFFFLARYWLRDRALRAVAIAGFLAGAAVAALIAVGQFVTGSHLVVAEGARRVTSVYGHPNNLALYLERALPFALALLLMRGAASDERRATSGRAGRAASDGRRGRRGGRRVVAAAAAQGFTGTDVWLAAASVAVAAGIFLSFSRGAWVGVAVALAGLALLVGRRTVRVVILGALIVGALLLPFTAGARLHALLSGGGSVGLRELIWRSTLAMIRDHPAFGVGLDQFYYQYAPRYVLPAAWGERFTSHPHDLFLDFWVSLGIMGLAWVAWLLLAAGWRLTAAWRRAGEGERPLLAAAGLAMVAAFVHGTIDNFFFLIDLAFIWWFLLAIADIAIGATDVTGGDCTDGASAPREGW